MNTDLEMNELSLQLEDEEQTTEIYVSMMSMMRSKWEITMPSSDAMDLDDEVNEELTTLDSEANNSNEENSEDENDDNNKLSKPTVEEFARKLASNSKETEKTLKYRKYNQEQIKEFIHLITELVPVKDAALRTGIVLSSAYRFRKQWTEEGTIHETKKRGRVTGTVSDLKEEHTLFLTKIVDDFATITITQMWEMLHQKFPGLSVSKSSVYRHARNNCALSMKKLEKIIDTRNSDETIQKRKNSVMEWMADKEFDFEKNCIFLDEAGFNLHMTRTRGWSKKGKPAKSVVPANRGTSITILGAISAQGVIDISLRKPITVTGSKKRKSDGKVIKTTGRIGTRTEHYLAYLSNVMDVLDKNDMKGFYLVMDNAPIHKPATVRNFIEKRGYKCVYLPPYSPFLNTIELFWSKVKYGIKRNPFDTGDTLTPRIMESCSKVTLEDCQGWIRHSIRFFERCLAMEKNL